MSYVTPRATFVAQEILKHEADFAGMGFENTVGYFGQFFCEENLRADVATAWSLVF